ncbi:MAG: hypothetical protein KDK25_12675 [Leptospiraceae bacterium]|nr:hypothetical protein [Leptospiraceae bacterium]
MTIQDIARFQTVEASIDSWMDFVEYALASDFYKEAVEKLGDPNRASRITLLWTYLNTFSEKDRRKAEEDPEFFLFYARGFIDELATCRYRKSGYYDRDTRSLFLGKIKAVLRAQKEDGKIIRPVRYIFLTHVVRFCSNLPFIIESYDMYKDYLFRLRSRVERPRGL